MEGARERGKNTASGRSTTAMALKNLSRKKKNEGGCLCCWAPKRGGVWASPNGPHDRWDRCQSHLAPVFLIQISLWAKGFVFFFYLLLIPLQVDWLSRLGHFHSSFSTCYLLLLLLLVEKIILIGPHTLPNNVCFYPRKQLFLFLFSQTEKMWKQDWKLRELLRQWAVTGYDYTSFYRQSDSIFLRQGGLLLLFSNLYIYIFSSSPTFFYLRQEKIPHDKKKKEEAPTVLLRGLLVLRERERPVYIDDYIYELGVCIYRCFHRVNNCPVPKI